MGHYTRSNGYGGQIRCFKPDDTEKEFWIEEGASLQEIGERAAEHFKRDKIELSDITISAEYIHTDCLGYDKYDAGDYTNYLRISIL